MIDIIETEAIRKRMIAIAVVNIPGLIHGGLTIRIQHQHHPDTTRDVMKVILTILKSF
jgi:hypothetical protein